MLILILIQMMGAVMLLLFAVRMVRTGFERASGPSLRRVIGKAASGRVTGAASGAGVAILLQSATAVAMLAAGFASSGFLSTAAGLSVLLGADLGSALVVQFLSFDLKWLVPLLLAAGAWMFLKVDMRMVKQTGRILIGIALILISLEMIGDATVPLKGAKFMPQVARLLADDGVTALLIGALLAFLLHSSVAAVLMIAAFAQNAGLPVTAAIPLVLGANVGAGAVAIWLTRGLDPKARRLPFGNFVFRAVGAFAALGITQVFPLPLGLFGNDPVQQVVAVHLLFNLALVVVCLPLVEPVAKCVDLLMSSQKETGEAAKPMQRSALDDRVVHVPRIALASATRELLRMGEIVETMAHPVMVMMEHGKPQEIQRLQDLDKDVNKIHSDIKLYIAALNRGELTREDAERSLQLVSFAVNIERAGDLVSKNLFERALDLQRAGIGFSAEGRRELEDMHDRVLANMRLALNVLVSDDVESARELIAEKDRMRSLEQSSHDRHLARLKAKTPESMDSSNAHMEVVRSLKEINALFAAVAVPILAREGQIRETRLVPAE